MAKAKYRLASANLERFRQFQRMVVFFRASGNIPAPATVSRTDIAPGPDSFPFQSGSTPKNAFCFEIIFKALRRSQGVI
ncbi:MAG: hypothetical protein IPH16_14800 [Haliscomenobacter sp.]|nr:hypothetical protein [Haliscomenobacter sp.]